MNNKGSIGINTYSQLELDQALVAITSVLHKCEKSLLKISPGTPQHTLLINRIKALRISQTLIQSSINTIIFQLSDIRDYKQ